LEEKQSCSLRQRVLDSILQSVPVDSKCSIHIFTSQNFQEGLLPNEKAGSSLLVSIVAVDSLLSELLLLLVEENDINLPLSLNFFFLQSFAALLCLLTALLTISLISRFLRLGSFAQSTQVRPSSSIANRSGLARSIIGTRLVCLSSMARWSKVRFSLSVILIKDLLYRKSTVFDSCQPQCSVKVEGFSWN
jgi:hypothetical protein